jgi:hypothetical protein
MIFIAVLSVFAAAFRVVFTNEYKGYFIDLTRNAGVVNGR